MNWFEQAWKHLKILNHRKTVHIRAYGDDGGKKYWILPTKKEEDFYVMLAPIYGKEWKRNISIGIADYRRPTPSDPKDDYVPDSVCNIVLDFDRADKDRMDGVYISEMAKEVDMFRNFLAAKGLKRGSLLFSGTGFHLYLPIPRIMATYEAFESMKALEEWMWDEFKTVAEPTHIVLDNGLHPGKVMRLAGTYNRKAGKPRMVNWVDYSGYDPDEKLLMMLKFVR